MLDEGADWAQGVVGNRKLSLNDKTSRRLRAEDPMHASDCASDSEGQVSSMEISSTASSSTCLPACGDVGSEDALFSARANDTRSSDNTSDRAGPEEESAEEEADSASARPDPAGRPETPSRPGLEKDGA